MWRLSLVTACVIALASWSGAAHAPPQAVATFDLSKLPVGTKNSSADSIAFVSETSIAVALCGDLPDECSLSLVRWDGEILHTYASRSHFRPGMSLYGSNEGKILAVPATQYLPASLFGMDLSTVQDLPGLHTASRSGAIAAQIVPDGWKLFRVNSGLEPIREGKGSLRSISDEIVVFQDSDIMRIETLDGGALGAFPVASESKCNNSAYALSTNELYFADCKKSRIVDFTGKERVELHPSYSGWCKGLSFSFEGKRVLLNLFSRKISFLRNAGEAFVALGTLGMGVADEQVNHEEVMVLDATTGTTCFDWQRKFREGASVKEHAAISPSGESVAIATDGKLSVFRVSCASTK